MPLPFVQILSFWYWLQFSSVQFSRSVMSVSLRPHESQHARSPCPSPTSGVYSNSCPSSQWCHQSFHPLSSPSPPTFNLSQHQMSQFFSSGGQSIEVSASTSVLPVNTQDWFPLGMDWFDLLTVQGTLKNRLQYHGSKASILWYSAFFRVQLSHPYIITGKTKALTRWTLLAK